MCSGMCSSSGWWVLGAWAIPILILDVGATIIDLRVAGEYLRCSRHCSPQQCLLHCLLIPRSYSTFGQRKHGSNFRLCMMVARNCCMALHYKQILKKYLFCPVSIAYGKTSDTRKTMALFIGLSLLQVFPLNFV